MTSSWSIFIQQKNVSLCFQNSLPYCYKLNENLTDTSDILNLGVGIVAARPQAPKEIAAQLLRAKI